MRKVLKLLLILLLIIVLVWGGLMAMIAWKEHHLPPTVDHDAIVVLGAQVKPDGEPSLQLGWRLDKAYEIWQEAPCPIIVCGAQGSDEPAPEGDVMRAILIGKGVPEDSVFSDPTSYNTSENLRHAAAIMAERGLSKPLIVTSDYHLPRALALAADQGMDACGVGSPIKPVYWLKNHAREALSWVKYWAQKYILNR